MGIILSSGCSRKGNEKSVGTDSFETAELSEQYNDSVDNPEGGILALAFVGDIMPGSTFPDNVDDLYIPREKGKYLFEDCTDILKGCDFAFGNLEGTICDNGIPRKECENSENCYYFRIPTYFSEVLKKAGFDHLNLANNHSLDFGIDGLETTIKSLNISGIKFSGIINHAPYSILEKGGIKIAVIGYAAGGLSYSVNEEEKAKKQVNELSKEADIVIVSMHGGAEGNDYDRVPKEMEIFHDEKRGNVYSFAHSVIDAGADVVWGHGPHVVRGMEVYNGKLIMYSLGNFCTPYRMNITGKSGEAPLIKIKIDKEGDFVSGNIYSFKQKRGEGPRIDVGKSVARRIKKLSEADFGESAPTIVDEGKFVSFK